MRLYSTGKKAGYELIIIYNTQCCVKVDFEFRSVWYVVIVQWATLVQLYGNDNELCPTGPAECAAQLATLVINCALLVQQCAAQWATLVITCALLVQQSVQHSGPP